ncbi:MAG: PAS domain S-box protein, partial [Anaerolineae bacterium]
MKNRSFKGPWVITAVAVLLAVAILILGNRSFEATEKATFDEFNQRQLVLARGASSGIELYFDSLARHMQALGRMSDVQRLNGAATRRELQQSFDELIPMGVNDIAVLDANGVVRYNVMAPQIEGVDFSWRQYFQETKKATSGDTYIVEFIEFKGVEAGEKGVLVAAPMFETFTDVDRPSPPGQFAGVVLCTLKLDIITQRFVVPVKSLVSGHVFLIDDEYDVLWAPDRSLFGKDLLEAGEGFPAFQQIVERMGAGVSGTAEYTYRKFEDSAGRFSDDTEEVLVAYAPVHLGNRSWAVGVWAPKGDARRLIRTVYRQQLSLVGLSMGIILLGFSHALAVYRRAGQLLEREVEAKTSELRQSEARYRRLVELSPDAIAVQSSDSIVFVNRAGANLFGAESPEDLIGKSVWDFVLPERRELVRERYRRMREEGARVPPIEQRFIRLDGTHVDAEAVATPFTYQGKPATLAIFHDITERKRAEEALEAARAFQQSILDGVAEPILVIGADYRVQLMNRAAREFSYGEADAPEPVYCYQVSHRREAPCSGRGHPCPMKQVRESGQTVRVVHEHYRGSGERRFAEIMASPLWGEDGTFQGIIESVRDITERRQLHEEMLKLRKAVEAAGEVMFMTDCDGIITYINPEFTRLYGHEADEVVGETTPRILKSGMMTPRDYELFWETLLSKQVVKGEVINKCKDGTLVTIDGSANPILDENGEIIGFLAIQRDITERKQAEETLQHYTERLQALTAKLVEVAEEERQRVARELHDETSQALANLVVTLGTVARITRDEETRRQLEQAKQLVVGTLEGVNRIVHDLRPRLLDDYGLLPAIRWYAEERLGQAGVDVGVEVQGTEMRLPAHTETAVFRMIQEAMNNIVRHAQATQATVRLTWERHQLAVEVIDDGRGYDVQETLNGARRDQSLGLLGMQERAMLVGGTLSIDSESGAGTRVLIQVPV